MRYSGLSLAGAIIALGAAIVSLFVPVDLFGAQELLVVAVAVLAIVQAARVAAARHRHGLEQTDPPVPEARRPVTVPGEELDDLLAKADARSPYTRIRSRQTARERIQQLVESTLVYHDGYPPNAVDRAIADGTWTGDPDAAALFIGGRTGGLLGGGLLATLSLTSEFTHRAERVASSLEDRLGIEPADAGRLRSWGFDRGWTPDHDGEAVATTTSRETNRWSGISLVALVGIGVGVLLELPAVVLASSIGIAYAAYARIGDAQRPDLAIHRSIDADDPAPGERADVGVQVHNEGDSTLVDLRLIDGVPEMLRVVDGTARIATSLRPGETVEFSYSVELARGTHEFVPATAITRSLNGSFERVQTVQADDRITCVPPEVIPTDPIPLRERGSQFHGLVPTSSGGEGIEYHSSRAYQPGDAIGRIDWGRYARTGELTTMQFREERAATVIILVDARDRAFLSPRPGDPHAVERALDGVDRLLGATLQYGNRVGLASVHADPCWLEPKADREIAFMAKEAIATHPSFSPVPASKIFLSFRWKRWFDARVPKSAQIVLISPLGDEQIVSLVRELEIDGHPVTVLCPDATAGRTLGQRLARLETAIRRIELQRRGTPVIEWRWDEGLELTLERFRAVETV